MTVEEFKIWLIQHHHTQATLAVELDVTSRTISRYIAFQRFPKWFPLALRSIGRDQVYKLSHEIEGSK